MVSSMTAKFLLFITKCSIMFFFCFFLHQSVLLRSFLTVRQYSPASSVYIYIYIYIYVSLTEMAMILIILVVSQLENCNTFFRVSRLL